MQPVIILSSREGGWRLFWDHMVFRWTVRGFVSHKQTLKGTVENSVFFPIHPHSPLNPFIPMSDQDNFSLQYQYNIKQISDENKEKYQFGDN